MENKSKKKAPFPQADDFEKVISIINIDDVNRVKDKIYVSNLLGHISDRQVAYYTSACFYLGILDENKCFTSMGEELRNKNIIEQEIALCMLLVKNDIFSEIYFTEKIFGSKLEKEDIIVIMKNNNVHFESDEMYKRRATTVRSWVDWLEERAI